jgi:uncharacterized protein (TIGR02453 family)
VQCTGVGTGGFSAAPPRLGLAPGLVLGMVGCESRRVATFSGFSGRAVAFYAQLAANNTRDFWTASAAVYESEVRDPMRALVDELESEFGPAKIFRPHRDVRFSGDKTPYKTHQAALVGDGTGIGYYVSLDAQGLTAGGGFRAHAPAQVLRYRVAVDAEATGTVVSNLVAELLVAGFDIEGEELKTKPRGYEADHPRIDLLRRRSLMAVRVFGTPGWLGTPGALDEVRHTWRQVRPLNEWVAAHVGPA